MLENIIKNNDLNALSYPPCELDKKYTCPICQNVMVKAHQADDCGCQYCHDCLAKL